MFEWHRFTRQNNICKNKKLTPFYGKHLLYLFPYFISYYLGIIMGLSHCHKLSGRSPHHPELLSKRDEVLTQSTMNMYIALGTCGERYATVLRGPTCLVMKKTCPGGDGCRCRTCGPIHTRCIDEPSMKYHRHFAESMQPGRFAD